MTSDDLDDRIISFNQQYSDIIERRCSPNNSGIWNTSYSIIYDTLLYFEDNLDEFDSVTKHRINRAIYALSLQWYGLMDRCMIDFFSSRDTFNMKSFDKGANDITIERLSGMLKSLTPP